MLLEPPAAVQEARLEVRIGIGVRPDPLGSFASRCTAADVAAPGEAGSAMAVAAGHSSSVGRCVFPWTLGRTHHDYGSADETRGRTGGSTVPRYDVRCRACGTTFEVTRSMARADEPAPCPHGHDDTVRLLPTVGLAGRSSTRTATAPAPAGGGGGCCGGGCCS
jgi:putative FmdB family regulatory protein